MGTAKTYITKIKSRGQLTIPKKKFEKAVYWKKGK
jgi:bifunctional DNA-binding transcriptional regulator/antitoxin component of YhaV-PrlF toxin-antitoxin module